MKKIILGMLILLFVIGGNLHYSKNSFAGNPNLLNGNQLVLVDYSNGEEIEYSIKINKDGTFYKNVISGKSKGDFEAWDGESFYRYDTEYGEMLIVNNPKDGSKVIPHPFLSEVLNGRVTEDIEKRKLKKTFLSKEYKKVKGEVVEKIVFDENNTYPKEYGMYIGGEKTFEYRITKLNELEKEVNISDVVNVDKWVKEDIEIIRLEESSLDFQLN